MRKESDIRNILFIQTLIRSVLPVLTAVLFMPAANAAGADNMTLMVEGKGFYKQVFRNGDSLWTDRKYVVEQMPETSIFKGFEFLKSKCNYDESANLIPDRDGTIYILAKHSATIEGWSRVSNSMFYYDNGKTAMSVFQKDVLSGQVIPLPATGDFQGASPLAKKIILIDPDKPDEMKIIVEEESENFGIKTLRENIGLFTGPPLYNLENIPEDFYGYTFLSGRAGQQSNGTIIPSRDGLIYVIARRGGLDGWKMVENTVMYSDYTCDETCIYRRAVFAGEQVPLPVVNSMEGVSPLAKEIELRTLNPTPVDEMSVTVKADDGVFDKRVFENGAYLFTNRYYVVRDIPEKFAGYEFLASKGGEADELDSQIIPASDGYIYLIAKNSIDPGDFWTVVPNSEFYYTDSNNSRISIFRRKVVSGESISFPDVGTDFRGTIPLAKTIRIEKKSTGTANPGLRAESAFQIQVISRKLHIEQVTTEPFDLLIRDVTGRVWYGKRNVMPEEISLYSWPDGIYLIQIVQNDKQYITKIVLQ